MAGGGREQPASRAGNLGIVSGCDARYDALSSDRVEVLARTVLLVADMAIPDHDRAAVLARVVAAMSPTRNDS
jgi:hypothetical protein